MVERVVAMETKVNVAVVGLGARGLSLLEMVFLEHPAVSIVAVCDLYADRHQAAAEVVLKKGQPRPFETTDYGEVLSLPNVDAVLICTSWEDHIYMAMEAMEAGIYVGLEVGGAYSVQECWDIVQTYERTKVPVMLLENCCYGRNELMLLNMVEKGVFGEIVHCAGGYLHDLRPEIAFGRENRHYRLRNYKHRNCENYPTHELGPLARILDINRGNRLLSLTSQASKAKGLHDFIRRHKAEDESLMNADFAQGDVVTTVIKCARGETIVLNLDTTLPRYYSRGLQIHGTRGMYNEANQSIFLDGVNDQDHFTWSKNWGNLEEYRKQYEHPTWRQYLEEGVKQGHGGMDWLVYSDFIAAVQNKTPTPIDVYDLATWMSITALSEESIALGGHPVFIPDFTKGKWIGR